MFGKDKKQIRMMAMDKMMKDKPMFADKLAEKAKMKESDAVDGDGMVSMAVTPEEKMAILAAREKNQGEDALDGGADDAAEGPIA